MERFAIKIDKSLRANLYKICRLCGIDNPDKIKVRDDANIVNLEDGEPELWKKVFDCIGLLITKDDKMPQFMCTLCVDKINDFFEFREMCYATDGQTRKLLGIKGEPKSKVQAIEPSPSIDVKCEDIKEPIVELTPLRAGRKRRNADMEIIKDVKLDISEDVKPCTTSIATSATKKKRMKLSNTSETETKIEPSTKPPKKEPALKVTPKAEPVSKIPLSKKRLKTEPVVKENKKDIKSTKITKLMKKKLKTELETEVAEPTKKKKIELIKLKKLPQLVVKAEKLKRGLLETKIKEETPVAIPKADPSPVPEPAPSTKIKSKLKCTICSEGFINKVHLDKHVKTTHIPTVHRYHCVQCNETLKKNMEIKNHNLWHKLSKTPFKCGKCSETSCSIYTYSKHIRDCNQIAYLDSHIPDWHCPDCSGNYETTYLFNIHSCVAKGLVCPGCDIPLKWKEDYFKHIPKCSEAFQRIPPYMTSNIQVKNEAELPTSPIPPLTTIALPATTITSVTVQSTSSSRVTPPQMDSNQCVVIPGNISLHEDTGASSPSKTTRKGKRITKKDLKRFDKLLKSTMTTLVSIKHEPTPGEDPSHADDGKPSSSEVKEQSELPASPLDSPPGSPMACGGDDFHHNGDDSESADEQMPDKPVGTIKQEIIDEGYRDLYNNIEVNIKHEIDAGKTPSEESQHKRTAEEMNAPEESSLAPKPILKLKITKEHGTLNSILMDSPKSEKKKKKKKRKEDRNKSPEKEERVVTMDTPATPTVNATVNKEVPDEKADCVQTKVPMNQTSTPESNEPDAVMEPPMPLPEIINIKKELNIPEECEVAEEEETKANAEAEREVSSEDTPSIIAASSGSLQISCVSEGVLFNRSDENEESMPPETPCSAIEQTNLPSEEPADWVEPIPCMELSLASKELTEPTVEENPSIEYPMTQETEEEVDIKPRLEDLIPMLQIASVTSGAEAIDKPIRKTVKRKRRQNATKPNTVPKIVSVSSGNEVASYQPPSDVSSEEEEDSSKKIAESNENQFDFSQVRIKEEVVDPTYNEEDKVEDEEEVEADKEATKDDREEEEEEEEEELKDNEEQREEQNIEPLISKKQAEENAYIANIDFNNLTIKQEKEYIDDGLENSLYQADEDADEDGVEEDEDEEVEEECSDDSDEDSSDDDSNKSDSESEREYRELPSDTEMEDKNDELLSVPPKIAAIEKEPPTAQTNLGLQILSVHSEFCHQSIKKTESEESISDDKLGVNSTAEMEKERELEADQKLLNLNPKSSTPMKEIDNCNKDHESLMEVDNVIQPEPAFKKPIPENVDIQEKSAEKQMPTIEIEKSLDEAPTMDKTSLQPLQMAETDHRIIQVSTSRTNSMDHCESIEVNPESLKSDEIENEPTPIPCETTFKNTSVAKVCDVNENKEKEQIKPSLRLSNDEQSKSINATSQETIQNTDNLNLDLYPENFNVDSTERPLQVEGISCSNTTVQSVSTPQVKSDAEMLLKDQCTNDSRLCVKAGEDHVIDDQEAAQKDINIHTGVDGLLPNLTDFLNVPSTSQCSEQEPSPSRLVDPNTNCETPAAENLSELNPVNDTQQDLPEIPTPVQSLIGSHLPSNENSSNNYALSDTTGYKDHSPPITMEPPPSHVQNTLPTSLSVPANHTPDANALLDMGHAVGNSISNMNPPYDHDRRELNPSESVFNIPPSQMEFQQFNAPGSSYAPYNCNSDPSSFSEYLTPPTAGQLQTSLVQQPVVNESPELSSNSLTNLSVLSEEVQNLLNEDTVAINNFEFNDNILRARSSAPPQPNNPAPIFNDFENLNEIAENNNNANIERELQDELGNVLADAIADRSNDDAVDDNNVMNENRANFDIT